MAEEQNLTDRIVVRHNPSAPAPKRITEDQFKECASDWLAQAKRGQQIIVVDSAAAGGTAMVLGMNGVLFQLPEDMTPEPPKPKAETENEWLK